MDGPIEFFLRFWHITSLAITDQKLLFYPYIFAKNKAPEVKMPKIDTLDALDDRMTSMLKTL